MGILDAFKKNVDKKEEPHTTPPPKGHTLSEIMHDKKNSHLFGKMLAERGYEDLALRIAEGKLEESDIDRLEGERQAFSEKIIQTERIEKLLTKENIIALGRNHPDFEKILNLVGPEKAMKAIQSQLREVSVTDENRFLDIVTAMETFESYKNGAYKDLSDRVEKLCKDNKISQEEYLKALAIDDPAEKEKALKELSSKKASIFKKALHWATGGEFVKGKIVNEELFSDLGDSESLMRDRLAELNTYNNDIGSVLAATVGGNDDMRGSLFTEMMNDKAPEVPQHGFKEAKNEKFDEEFVDGEWEKEKEDVKGGYDKKTPAQQDAIKDIFIAKAKEHYRAKTEGKGFWSAVFETLNEALIDKKKATLK